MRMILNCVFALAAVAAAVFVAGCGDSGGSGDEVVVSATTPQLADIARHVAGDRAEVDGILEANSDPHEYEPKPSDVEGVAEADLVLRSGGDLDEWLDQLIESAGTDSPSLDLIDHVEVAGDDPHWWQDPRNGIAAAEAIRDALIEVDPEGESSYSRNTAAYVQELEQLDAAIAGCMEGVPAEERKLVTSHDALGPYADRYGIEVIGAAIPALTTQAQASAGETAELVETIRAAGVSTIFPEAGVSADLEQVIADEAGARVGDELWADTLGPEGSGAETYADSLAANTAALVKGFTDGRQSCLFTSGG